MKVEVEESNITEINDNPDDVKYQKNNNITDFNIFIRTEGKPEAELKNKVDRNTFEFVDNVDAGFTNKLDMKRF